MKGFVFAFWIALGIAAVMALVPHLPFVSGGPSDKLQHVIAFLSLAGLGRAAFPQAPPLRIGLWLCAFEGAIALAQTVPALNRDGDVRDWIADVAAVATMLVLTEIIRMRSPGRSG